MGEHYVFLLKKLVYQDPQSHAWRNGKSIKAPIYHGLRIQSCHIHSRLQYIMMASIEI